MREDQLPRIKDRGSSSEAPLEALLGQSSDDPGMKFTCNTSATPGVL